MIIFWASILNLFSTISLLVMHNNKILGNKFLIGPFMGGATIIPLRLSGTKKIFKIGPIFFIF
jgi:hypothetical protein